MNQHQRARRAHVTDLFRANVTDAAYGYQNGHYNDIGDLEPLHIRSELKTAEPDWKRLVKGMWNPSKAVKGLSLLAGYAAGEAYSMYAVFEAHTLTPVTAYLTEQTPFLRAVSGKYREVFDLGGLLPVVLASLVVFTMAWCMVRGTALALVGSE